MTETWHDEDGWRVADALQAKLDAKDAEIARLRDALDRIARYAGDPPSWPDRVINLRSISLFARQALTDTGGGE